LDKFNRKRDKEEQTTQSQQKRNRRFTSKKRYNRFKCKKLKEITKIQDFTDLKYSFKKIKSYVLLSERKNN